MRKDALDLLGEPDWVVRGEVNHMTRPSSKYDKGKLKCIL